MLFPLCYGASAKMLDKRVNNFYSYSMHMVITFFNDNFLEMKLKKHCLIYITVLLTDFFCRAFFFKFSEMLLPFIFYMAFDWLRARYIQKHIPL